MRNKFARFDTALGECFIAWSDRGVTALRLPGSPTPPGAEEDRPPLAMARVIRGIRAHLAGRPARLEKAPIDPGGTPFQQAVWAAARRIPAGKVRTYGEIGREIGRPGAARAVGAALGANPVPLLVPCHRVVARDGSLHGFSAPGGVATKRRLLDLEGHVD